MSPSSNSRDATSTGRRAQVAFAMQLNPDRFPVTVAVADALPAPPEDAFEFGLRLIITGPGELRHPAGADDVTGRQRAADAAR
ncbi:hypothetical protein [Amycolatopsis sp. CB00013]|uniref:hypothetical protein n=1 Tax=Amycolatopsis sp. CB00013 TaxID=1703945 RepID=UPI00093D45F5|nr:hypothetical protein [Amycolatopsis sp. CB00013]OKJ97863.1 hypothetical protein AMK34_12980 [Amycolatopsis sp. CB00013]